MIDRRDSVAALQVAVVAALVMVIVMFILLFRQPAITAHQPRVSGARLAASVEYARDERTGICFAEVQSAGYYGYKTLSVTAVPCSPEVLVLISAAEERK